MIDIYRATNRSRRSGEIYAPYNRGSREVCLLKNGVAASSSDDGYTRLGTAVDIGRPRHVNRIEVVEGMDSQGCANWEFVRDRNCYCERFLEGCTVGAKVDSRKDERHT